MSVKFGVIVVMLVRIWVTWVGGELTRRVVALMGGEGYGVAREND